MRLLFSTISTLLALFLPASANFDIYYGNLIEENGYDEWNYHVYNDHPTCEEVFDSKPWSVEEDVSDDKHGIRCKGSGAACSGQETENITELEMNFGGGEFHWTIYKDRDWAMFGLEGDKIAQCFPTLYEDYACRFEESSSYGWRLIRCYVDYDADDIRGHE